MKKKKVIYITYRSYKSFFFPQDSDYYYLSGHTGIIARNFLKYNKKYILENWRIDKFIKKPIIKEVRGIISRTFPSTFLPLIGEFSFSMLKSLRKEIKNNYTLVHHSGVHSNRLYFLNFFIPSKKIPIVASHFGGISPFIIPRIKKLSKRMKHSIRMFLDKKMLKYIDHFFVASLNEIETLTNSNHIHISKISFPEIGTDFQKFKPLNKEESRKALNLPLDKKILLYIGHFDETKGLDVILRIFPELKKKYNIILVLIGRERGDRFFHEVEKPDIYHYGYLPYDQLPLYHNAADLLIRPAFTDKSANAVGANVVESLACGTPVVSTTLKNFPTDERKFLGKIPKTEQDVIRCVCDILDIPSAFPNCREIVMKYYDWKNYIKDISRVYEDLFKLYYHQ